MDKVLIFIGARGGSKGVKDKNILPLGAHPLIAYTIAVAKRSRLGPAIVSTDSEVIGEIARRYGALVPFLRPSHLATDDAPKMLAIRHAVQFMEEEVKEKFDYVIDLQITSPIRDVEDVIGAFRMMKESTYDIVISATLSHANPYFNMLENKNGVWKKPCDREFYNRQEAPKVVRVNGSIYVYRRDVVFKVMSPLDRSLRIGVYEMPEEKSVDVDTPMDVEFLKFLVEKGVVKLPEVELEV